MHSHLIDDLAAWDRRPRASHGLLLAAQVLRIDEHRELPVSALNYREAAETIRDELRDCSTDWLLQMRLRLPAVVQSLVEDELDARRAAPAFDEAWRRQAAVAAWRPYAARLSASPGPAGSTPPP